MRNSIDIDWNRFDRHFHTLVYRKVDKRECIYLYQTEPTSKPPSEHLFLRTPPGGCFWMMQIISTAVASLGPFITNEFLKNASLSRVYLKAVNKISIIET